MAGDELTDHVHSALADEVQTHELHVFESWVGGIRDNGGQIPEPKPDESNAELEEARALREDIQKYMRENNAAYWRDPELQDVLRATIAATEDNDVSPTTPRTTPAVTERIRQIERVIREDNRAYWRNEAMQLELRQLLASQETGAPPPPATVVSRKSELQSMMGDRGSDYWRRGAEGEALQAEYRSIVAAEQSVDTGATPDGV